MKKKIEREAEIFRLFFSSLLPPSFPSSFFFLQKNPMKLHRPKIDGDAFFRWCVIALSIILTIEYYVHRQDTFDERFAWRMFSNVFLASKQVSFWAITQEKRTDVRIDAIYSKRWTRIISLGHTQVIKEASRHICMVFNGTDKVVAHLFVDQAGSAPISKRFVTTC
jgi:hypothetical protein